MTAALAAPQPAKVQYSFHGAGFQGIKIEDRCFVTPDTARSWGWNVSLRGNELQISCEGRLFRIPDKSIDGKRYVDITESSRYIGANTSWDGDTFRILGSVRQISITDKGLDVASTIQVQSKMSRLTGPDRLVIDLVGAELEEKLIDDLPTWWRAGQYNKDTVRLVIEHPGSVLIPSDKPQTTRFFHLDLPEICLKNPATLDSASLATIVPKPVKSSATKVVNVDKPRVIKDTPSETVLQIPLGAGLATTPPVRYIDTTHIELAVPGGQMSEFGTFELKDSRWIDSYTMTGDSATGNMRFETKAPMAFTVMNQGSSIIVRLFRPSASGGLAGKVVVVDPGHGGKDSGAHEAGVSEKNLTLTISKEVVRQLADAGASVITTRDEDTFPSLTDRANVANNSNADIFVSIHINSNSKSNSRSGTITFHHKDSAIGRLLAECIHAELSEVNNLPDIGVWSDGKIYQSGFSVLRNTKMPGVLLELGFINHSTDRAELQKKDFPARVAKAVVKGIKAFLGETKE